MCSPSALLILRGRRADRAAPGMEDLANCYLETTRPEVAFHLIAKAGIGNAYRGESHKVFQRRDRVMSLVACRHEPRKQSSRNDADGVHMEPHDSDAGRIARFLSDRHAYRERPDYLPELIVLGIVIIAAAWPILSLASAMELVR